MLFRCTLLAIVLALTSFAAEVKRDIPYGSDPAQMIDAATPDGTGPFPVVLIIHGGGWSNGDKAADIDALFQPLTDAKFVWFSANYRMAPQHHWPACFEDVQRALAWVKAHAAEYHGDPRRIAILGYSVGGQLASLVVVKAKPGDRPQAVVLLSSPTDLIADTERRHGLSPSLKALLAQTEVTPAVSKTLREMSSAFFIAPGLPPFLLLAGTADQSVPYTQATELKAKLDAAKVPVTLITMPEAPHAIAKWPEFAPDYPRQIVAWLQQH